MPEISGQPRIAVCLAVYNGMLWLTEQLDSILAQTGVSVKVFVSVDQSSDGSEAWIDQRAAADKRVSVLPHGHRFGNAAPNFFRILGAIDLPAFDYLSFADQDDLWLPDKLLQAHQRLASTGADAYSSNVRAFWSDGRESLITKSQPQTRWDFLFEAAGPGCTYVIKSELAQAIQKLLRTRPDDIYQVGLHDWLTYAFARAHGFRWVIDDYAGMLYRQHDANQVGVNLGWRASLHRARKVLSGWGLNQSLLIARLTGLENTPFVLRWSRQNPFGLLWLAFHAGQCRRRNRDQVLFALSCVALSLTRWARRRPLQRGRD